MQPAAAAVRPLSMADVAARAGVSHQTVSRVVNGHPSVAPHTRERVEQAIAELGYRPNIAARALVTGSTRTIGLVTVKINQYGPAQTMLGLEKAARAAGYSLSVSILDDATAGAMRDAVDTFVSQRVDAIVALSTYDDAAEALSMLESPVPLVAVQVGGDEERPAVGVDQVTGARLATRHLLELGHRTVHHVAGPADSQEARGRIEGWRAELEAAGAPVPEQLRGDWTPSSGYAAGRQLAQRIADGEEITAVFLANDQMALGLLSAFHESGIEAPDDVSVVGFDDLPEAPYFTPPLTTVRQDFAELGRRGVQLVLARLRGEDLHPRAGAGAARRAGQHRPGQGLGARLTREMLALTMTGLTHERPQPPRAKGSPDVTMDAGAAITGGRTALGIEFGSTRIKAVLIGPDHAPLAVGSHDWENQFVDRLWTYSLDAVWTGVQQSFAALADDVRRRHGVELTTVGALGRVGDDARLPRVRRRRCAAHAVPHLAQHEHGSGGRAAQRGVRLQHPAPVERRAPLPGDPGLARITSVGWTT